MVILRAERTNMMKLTDAEVVADFIDKNKKIFKNDQKKQRFGNVARV